MVEAGFEVGEVIMGIREYSVSGVPVPSGFDMEISEEFQGPPGCRFLCHDCCAGTCPSTHCRKASGKLKGRTWRDKGRSCS